MTALLLCFIQHKQAYRAFSAYEAVLDLRVGLLSLSLWEDQNMTHQSLSSLL